MLRDIFVVFIGILLALGVRDSIHVALGKLIKQWIDEALDESKKNQSYTNCTSYYRPSTVGVSAVTMDEKLRSAVAFHDHQIDMLYNRINSLKNDIETSEDEIEELNSWCKSNETKIGLIEKEIQKTNPFFLLSMESQEEE